MAIIATKANMRLCEQQPYQVLTPDGTALVRPAQPFAYSFETGERYSATPGDYFMLRDDEPLLDSEAEPMVLVFESTQIVHAEPVQ